MVNIAEVNGLKIESFPGYFISFLNSPFQSHRDLKAVDIFPISRKIEEVKSPISGSVIDHRIHTMRKNNKKEHVIIIDAAEYYVKILHVEPYIQIGEEVKSGQVFGRLCLSPYFRPWTDPHIHLEIRNREDFLRARGGIKLKIPNCSVTGKTILTDKYEIRESYILRKIIPARCGNFYGAGDSGIIDGGYPHYKYGLLLGGNEPKLLNKKIGEIYKEDDKIIKFNNDKIQLNGLEFLGIGFSIYLDENAYIKYIFKSPEDKKKFIKVFKQEKFNL